MSRMRVGILGATGHVGKVLTAGLAARSWEVTAYARSVERLDQFLATVPHGGTVRSAEIGTFGSDEFDALVNATGMGDPSRFGPDARYLIEVTEHFDRVVSDYVERHPACIAIAMSSGAVYASDFEQPAGTATALRSGAASGPDDAYGAVKAASEARHRATPGAAIVDVRLFGLFSRFIDLDAGFLLSQALRCIRSGETLVTDGADIVRDYAHPDDLTALVCAVAAAPRQNRVYDVYSAGPARKFEVLDLLSERFGLSYTVDEAVDAASRTGRKPAYYSTDRSAAALGWEPRFTSIGCVEDVTASLVESWRGANA